MIVDIHPYQNGLSILVAPTLLKAQDPLADVLEETNAVSVEAKANGPLTFIGQRRRGISDRQRDDFGFGKSCSPSRHAD
jgi:hypothetical protein